MSKTITIEGQEVDFESLVRANFLASVHTAKPVEDCIKSIVKYHDTYASHQLKAFKDAVLEAIEPVRVVNHAACSIDGKTHDKDCERQAKLKVKVTTAITTTYKAFTEEEAE